MSIPKWLAATWIAAVILGSAFYTPFAPTVQQQAVKGMATSFVFLIAAGITAIWLVSKRPGARVYVIVWAVALFLANAFTHLGPAQPLPPGRTNHLPLLGPITLAVAAAIMLATWAVQRYRKPHTT